jgi:transposase
MWTKATRGRYDRRGQRYPSDLTDEEWAFVEPHLPPGRRVDRREILNAILYVLTTGCQWRQLPKDFPPKSTAHDYFVEWHCDGTLTRLHHALYCEVREREGRAATPTTSIVDSQSVKSAEKGGPRSMPPAMMRARKSRARSVTSPSIRSA